VSAETWGPGAQVYEGAAEVAHRCGDARTELDALRMAAYCHERARKLDAAWERGVQAVAVGENMDVQTRNLARFGGRRFHGTEADVIHRAIEALRDHARDGATAPPPAPFATRIEFWM